jgi:hypothetical protein
MVATNDILRFAWILLGLALGVESQPLLAMDYHIRALGGVYQSTETTIEPVDGSTQNDAQAALGSLYLDMRKLGPLNNQFTFEFRDRYDSFGNLDQDQPKLVVSTEPEVRQLVLRYPNAKGSIYGAVGRFPVVDAATIANDGLELGFRATNSLRIGVFGGLYPERKDGNTVQLSEEGTQQGIYLDFDDRSLSRDIHTYVGSAIVKREPSQKTNEDPLSTEATNQARILSYNNIVFQPSSKSRWTGLTLFDLAPKPRAQNLWISYNQRYTTNLSLNLYLLRLDPTEYEKQRDIRDRLSSSSLTRAHLLVKHSLGKTPALWYDAAFGIRSRDKLTREQFGLRLVLSRINGGPLGAYVGAWSRKNYESKDTVYKGGLNYSSEKYDASLVQQYIIEKHRDGTTSKPLITDLTAGWFFNREVMGTATLEYAVDEKVTIVSGLIGIGLRMTSDQLTPPGTGHRPQESL